MRFGIKKSKGYAYGFNADEELTIYSKIGEKKSPYQNYCEWYSYVYEKYGRNKYTESTLKNFVHYLKREKNIITDTKEIWIGCAVPLFVVFMTIVYTFVFSVVSVINTYNDSINTLMDKEFLEYTGYSAEMIYETLEKNLYSEMQFYFRGAVIMIILVFLLLYYTFSKISSKNLKNEFYTDYIMIIQEIVEEQKVIHAETV